MTQLSSLTNNHSDSISLMAAIRGGAALVVAAVHAFQVFLLPYFGLWGFAHLATSFMATYAVMAFFVVSGFMIFLSTDRHRDADKNFRLADFLSARVLRIYPPLIASIILSYAVYAFITSLNLHGASSYRLDGDLFVSRERVDFEWDRLASTVFLLFNVVPKASPPLSINGPLWSLAYEWWFYLFAAATLGLNSRVTFGRILLFSLILIMFLSGGFLLWMLFIIWHGGFLLGYLYKRGALQASRFRLSCVSGVLVCLLGIVSVNGVETLQVLVEPLQRLGNKAHITMMFVSLIMTIGIAVALKMNITGRWFIGASNYSFTLYLIHFPLLLLAFSLLHPILHDQSLITSAVAGFFVLVIIILLSVKLANVLEDRARIAGWLKRFNRVR